MALGTCRLGSLFSKCSNEASKTCQYCGRAICESHLYYEHAHDVVCASKRCTRKIDDMIVHREYEAAIQRMNKMGLCGIEDCGPSTETQCSRCRLRFCEDHVSFKMYPPGPGGGGRDIAVSVCDHCWERRKIWR